MTLANFTKLQYIQHYSTTNFFSPINYSSLELVANYFSTTPLSKITKWGFFMIKQEGNNEGKDRE